MQAYSLDLRQRVVSAYENDMETILEVAERFEVSDSFARKAAEQKTLHRHDCSGRTSRRATETLVGDAPKEVVENRPCRSRYNA